MTNLYSYYTQVLFIIISTLACAFEIYLAQRQLFKLQQSQNEVPEHFKQNLTLQDHQKAISYATTKLKFSRFHMLWDLAFLFYWFPFRGAEKLMLSLPDWGIHREVLFLILFGLIQMLIGLPWSIYSTFVIEEKFGFNKTTSATFITDRLKGLIMGALFGVPILYGMIWFFNNVNHWWLVSFITITLFQFLLIWIYPTVIAPWFNKFKPLEQTELKSQIEELIVRAGFQSKGIFVMDASKRSSHGNAYFTGLGKNKRIVFFDTLLKDLESFEIIAILAHELGHLKFKHIIKGLITSLIISFFGFYLMGKLADLTWFYHGHFIRIQTPAMLILIFTQIIPIYTFWSTPISSWISRKREFEADRYAAQESKPEYLISGLMKLYKQNASPVVVDKLYANFYYSHPPAHERIEYLKLIQKQAQ